MRPLSLFATAVASAGLGGVLVFLLGFATPLLTGHPLGTLFSTTWNPEAGQYGLLPMVVGTLLVALVATAIGFIGALAVALQFETLREGRLKQFIYRGILVLGAIPTVVYGLVGVLLLVPWLRLYVVEGAGWSIFSAGAMLSLVIWPTMVLFLIDSFRVTPPEFLQITSALGGERIQYQLNVLLPFHRRSIGVALSLGLARAMGDTMIALMLAGNSLAMPHALTDPARTLTAHIALLFAGDFDSPAFRSIFVSGLILLGLTVVLQGVIVALRKEKRR